MTEPQLQNLLNRAVLRMRIESVLKYALAAAVFSLGVAALAVFTMRGFASEVVKIEWLSALPPIAALLSGGISLMLHKPTLEEVAAILDRRANTREHLTT